MSLNIQFWQLSKKPNSTGRPSTTGTTYTGTIKDPCGIVNPTIAFDISDPTAFNYAYIPTFRRYYFIREWTYNKSFWYASLECDVMASARSEIGAETEFVLRSAYTCNADISDGLYPVTSKVTWDHLSFGSLQFATNIAGGVFVMGVIGAGTNGMGSTTYYSLTPAGMREFNDYLLSGANWAGVNYEDISDMTESFLKTLFNPYQYVTSCIWLPFQIPASYVQPVASIKFGWWDIPMNTAVRVITTPQYVEIGNVTLTNHAQYNADTKRYLNYQPYREVIVFIPGVGEIPVNPMNLAPNNILAIQFNIDLTDGSADVFLSTSGGAENRFNLISTQMGVPVIISQMGKSVTGYIASLIGGAVAGVASFLGADTSAVTNLANAIGNETHQVGSNGGFSQIMNLSLNQCVIVKSHWVTDDDNTHNGRPLYQPKQISTIPGYILCENAEIATSLTYDENQKIIDYMNGGFYYE